MTQMNPITGALIAAPAAERAASSDKAAQLKRVERNRKNTPAGDSFEQTIQSPDELEAVSDEHHKRQPGKRQQQQKNRKQADDDDQPHLDIRA